VSLRRFSGMQRNQSAESDDVPFAVDLAHRLRKRGAEISGRHINTEEMVDYIACSIQVKNLTIYTVKECLTESAALTVR